MESYDPYPNLATSYTTPPSRAYEQPRSFSIIGELSPKESLHDIMQHLRGKMWDPILKRYVEVEGANKLMNEEGIDMFFHHATTLLNQIVTMSNYTTDYDRIHKIVRMLLKEATVDFHLHWKEYGINRKTKISIITSKLMILGLSALYHALGAGDRKAGTSNISESINTLNRPEQSSIQEQKRRGIFQRMLPK